jgi:hypothetical protein
VTFHAIELCVDTWCWLRLSIIKRTNVCLVLHYTSFKLISQSPLNCVLSIISFRCDECERVKLKYCETAEKGWKLHNNKQVNKSPNAMSMHILIHEKYLSFRQWQKLNYSTSRKSTSISRRKTFHCATLFV